MNKRTLAVIGIVVITASMFAGCKQKDDAVDATASTVSTSQTAVSEESAVSDENTTIEDGSSDNSSTADTTAEKGNGSTTTKAAAGQTTTAAKTTAKQATKAAAQSAKQTTKATTKATTRATTKATTTVKNVSAKDVQAQVNSYIRSKGITVDSSLNPWNSGWTFDYGANQNSLNDGQILKNCKGAVDREISNMGTDISMYCYLDGNDFYICYMMNWG